MGFSGAAKGPFATAEFYRLEKGRSYRLAATASLLNPVAPAEFFVTDNGILMTLDNWHNMGYGKVVAFYTPEGKPIRAYELSDLFTKSEIEGFDHSESSIHWRKFAGSYVRPGGDTLNVTIHDAGGSFVFERSGAYQYCETRGGTFLWRIRAEPGKLFASPALALADSRNTGKSNAIGRQCRRRNLTTRQRRRAGERPVVSPTDCARPGDGAYTIIKSQGYDESTSTSAPRFRRSSGRGPDRLRPVTLGPNRCKAGSGGCSRVAQAGLGEAARVPRRESRGGETVGRSAR